MNMKTKLLTAAILVGISTAAFSQDPPSAPSIYNNGPNSPLVATTDLSLAEHTAYANYEALLQIVEARIYAFGADKTKGVYQVSAFSDGSIANPSQNYATLLSNGSSLTVKSNASAPDTTANRGQLITVNEPTGTFLGTAVTNYVGYFAYNGPNNLLDATSTVSVVGINGRPDEYDAKIIKDFYRGGLSQTNTDGSVNVDYFNIFDWGLGSLDKLGYPVNKYWQQSKSHRDDGSVGRTVFVKDRLVGATHVRIIIDTKGFNNADYFEQSGTLTVDTTTLPGAPVPAFAEYPFI